MISRAALEALVPLTLTGRRMERYRGDGLSTPLGAFHERDRILIVSLYHRLHALGELLRALVAQTVVTPEQLQALGARTEWAAVLQTAKHLGVRQTYPLEARQTIHDLRGGSLTALIATVGLLKDVPDSADVLQMYYYARDHLKIMRNGVPEIDPPAARRDGADSPHSFDLLRQKWSRGSFAFAGTEWPVVLDCAVSGAVAERSLEFAALDRILYNLVNNAARHGSPGPISLTVFTPGSPANPNACFAVANRVALDRQAELLRLTGGNPGRLLRGGLSTSGGGMGLQICAQFVRHAYGLASVDELLAEKFAGVQLVGDHFVAWFHWPRAV